MNTVAILVPEQRTIISAALKLIRLRYIGAQEIICNKEKNILAKRILPKFQLPP